MNGSTTKFPPGDKDTVELKEEKKEEKTGCSSPMLFSSLPKPEVCISTEVWEKLHHWVKKGASHECSGMGKIIVENGKIRIVDAWMVKQTNSGAETEMDADALGKLYYQKKEVPGAWQFWWHSHSTMGVFWSGTDVDQIGKIAANGMCIALVLNVKGESLCCVAVNNPFPMHMDGVAVTVGDGATAEKKAEWDKEYDDNVVAKTWSHSDYFGRYNDWDWGSDDSIYMPRGSLPKEGESRISRVSDAFGKGSDTKLTALAEHNRYREVFTRLREVERCIKILEWTLRDRKVTKSCCEIIEIEWSKGLEMDCEITGMQRMGVGFTIENAVEDMLVTLYEEQDVLEKGIAAYASAKQ